MKATVKINNMPKDPKKYVVARVVDGELWYYGSFDEEDENRSKLARKEINGIIAEVQK